MVVSPQQKDLVLDICIPNKGLVVESSRKQALVHLRPIAPSQRVHSLIMPSQLLLKLMRRTVPKTDIPSEASRHQSLLGIDRQDISNRTGMSFLLRISLIKRIPPRNSPSFLQRTRIINMYDRIRSTRVKQLLMRVLPVRISDSQLYLRN